MAANSPEESLVPSAHESIILGGAGFIGTRLASVLDESHLAFRIADLRKSTAFPSRSVECDVRDLNSLRQSIRGAAAIINLAAEHRDDVRPLSRYQETNVQGAATLCEAARLEKVKKIIFTSSAAVYGFTPTPATEEGPFCPFNPYGETKLQAERVYLAWANEDSSRTTVIIRPTVIFGEGNRGNVYNLLRQIASKRFLMVGRGDNYKSMAYVENVAAFVQHTLSLGPGVHIFNYADLPDLSTGELIRFVLECLARPPKIRSLPKALALTAGHAFDLVARLSGKTFPVSAIRIEKFCQNTQMRADKVRESGFIAPYSLREGLRRTITSEFLSSGGLNE